MGKLLDLRSYSTWVNDNDLYTSMINIDLWVQFINGDEQNFGSFEYFNVKKIQY